MIQPINSLRTQLFRALRGTFLLKVASMFAALAASIMLARSLGPAGYGIYAFAFAIISIIGLPAKAGIPTLLVRETAKAQALDDWGTMKGLWRWATKVILATSLVLVFIATLAVTFFLTDASQTQKNTFLLAFLLIPLLALGNARGAALRGLRLIVRGQLPETLIHPGLLAGIVGLAWLLYGDLTPAKAMGISVFAAAIAFLVGALVLHNNRPDAMRRAHADYSARPLWSRAVIPLTLLAGIQVTNAQIGIILLGSWQSSSEVALYKVAAAAAGLAAFGLAVVNQVIAPHLARLHAQGNRERLQRIASVGAAISGALTLPIVVAYFAGGDFILRVLYGPEYDDALRPLLILATGQMVNALFGSVGLLLNMTGHEKATAKMLGMGAALNVVLCLLLVPDHGATGAAIAATVSLAVANLGFWASSKKRLNVDGSFVPVLRAAHQIAMGRINARIH